MNWDTYKRLSREQREEYDFRFNRNPHKGVVSPILWVLVFGSMILNMVLVIAITYIPELDNYSLLTDTLLMRNASFTAAFGYILLAEIAMWALSLLVLEWRKKRFLARIGVKA